MLIIILTLLFGVIVFTTYVFYDLYSRYYSKPKAILLGFAIGITFIALPIHGILLCGQIRDFIKESIFRGAEIEFFESSGWFERTFVIKGNVDDVLFIKRNLDRIA